MFKKLKKIVCFLFIICLSVTAFVACKEFKWGPYPENVALAGDVIGENGGMAVRKGGYLYFINGMDDYKDNLHNNEFGKVIRGSICRMPIADLDKPEATRNANVQVIVPKLIVANYRDAGFYIYGDHIYYTTPNSERGSGGGIQYTWVDFMKVKVDGTGTTRLAKLNPADRGEIPFKFMKSNADQKVYLVYYVNDGHGGTLYKINATNNGSAVKIADEINSFAFGESEVYYAREETYENAQGEEQHENFNTAWTVDPGASPVEISATLSGMTQSGYENAAKEDKYKFTIRNFEKDIMFFNRTKTFGGVDGDQGLWGYKADETIKIKPFTRNNLGARSYLTVGWNDGIVVFSGSAFVRYPGMADGAAEYDEQAAYTMYTPQDTSITLYFLDGNNIYYGVNDTTFWGSVSGAQIWRFDITVATPSSQMLASKTERVTLNAVHNEWLKPKLLEGRIFFINCGNFKNEDGDILDKHIEDGYEYYTYFVDTANLPDADVDDDDLADEVAKEVRIGKHDIKDKKED